jgi:hypothetical protein
MPSDPSISTRRPRGRRASRHLFLLAAALLATVSAAPAPASAAPRMNPPTGNWVWYYQGVRPSDASKFAGAYAVVVADQRDEAPVARTIHQQGALAFHYLNVFWYPSDREYEGVDLRTHPGWAFCRHGATPLVGRSPGGVPWYYADANERGLHDAVVRYLASLKADGYDGVFFDRGTVALGRGATPRRVSTCTSDPVTRGASYADAYAALVKAAHHLGLRVVLNYGPARLRPDVAGAVQAIMHETAPLTSSRQLATAFSRRRREEAAARGGAPRYIEELKTSRPNQRAAVFAEWATAGLWQIGITVNAGDNNCADAPRGAVCWRYGTFPELTRVDRGRPLDARPTRHACARGSRWSCVWERHFQRAIVVANDSPVPVRLSVAIEQRGCRVLTDVWSAAPLASGRCVSRVTVTIPALSGRVITERP